MSIQVIAQGTLLTKPETVDSDRGDVAAAMLGTRQQVHYEGQVIELDTVPTAELVCAGPLAADLLQLEKGDRVELRGTMTVKCRLVDVEDPHAPTRTDFHAESLSKLD